MTFLQEAESRLEFEAKLRQELSQQAAAHSDHLVDALRAQRVKLEAQFEKQLIVGVQAERDRMLEDIRAVVNRVNAIEAAVDGQIYSAVVITDLIITGSNAITSVRLFVPFICFHSIFQTDCACVWVTTMAGRDCRSRSRSTAVNPSCSHCQVAHHGPLHYYYHYKVWFLFKQSCFSDWLYMRLVSQ